MCHLKILCTNQSYFKMLSFMILFHKNIQNSKWRTVFSYWLIDWILSCRWLWCTGWGKSRFTVWVCKTQSLFLYYLWIIVLFSIQTTVNLLLPHLVHILVMQVTLTSFNFICFNVNMTRLIFENLSYLFILGLIFISWVRLVSHVETGGRM